MNGFSAGLAAFFLLLNIAISWFNAWAVGRDWPFRKYASGWHRLVMYCTAVMSACGFTWTIMFLIACIGYSLHDKIKQLSWLTATHLDAFFSLGYVLIGPLMVATGLIMTIDAVAHAVRTKRPVDIAVASYDVVAQISNMVDMVEYLPDALSSVADFFKPGGGDSDNSSDLEGIASKIAGWLLGIAFFVALLGGITLTATIIEITARNSLKRASMRSPRERLVRRATRNPW